MANDIKEYIPAGVLLLEPHEILKKIAQGYPIQQMCEVQDVQTGEKTWEAREMYVDIKTRINCAAAAAPYFAAKKIEQKVDLKAGLAIEEMSDSELDKEIEKMLKNK